ncbi:hypothetical protein [Halalkalicoccus salilacus]|uniref:hypothetical protein n=1 Tax=Halalkalicoccus salilacus TaxID=3117459 RepID=UPI00300E7E42
MSSTHQHQPNADIDEESFEEWLGETGHSGSHPLGYCDVCGEALIIRPCLNCAELRRIEIGRSQV